MTQLTAGFESLGDDINKSKGRTMDGNVEGAVSDYLPELELTMPNADISKLTKEWKKSWDESPVKAEWLTQVDDNTRYWKGKHFTKVETEQLRPLIDNQIFQSVETFLPAATANNPEAMVELRATERQTPENIKYTEIIRNRLSDWADDVKLRLKAKKVARHWLIALLGVGKMSWDMVNDRPSVKAVHPKKLILDADGITDEDGYTGKFVGEYRKMSAEDLITIISKEKDSQEAITAIKTEAKDELATEIQFIEWWTAEYMCWTLNDVVLRKKKNPHWNYLGKASDASLPDKADSDTEDDNDMDGVDTSTLDNEDSDADDNSTDDSDGADENEDGVSSNPPPEATPNEVATPATVATGAPALPNASNQPPANMPVVPTQTAPAPAPQALTEKDRNHFPTRRIPYVFLSIFNLGETPVDVTSLITQNLPQQDMVNKRLKQIDKNIDGMNGGVVVSEEKSGLTKEEAKGVTEALRKGGTVVVPAGNAQEAVYRMPSVALPSDVYNNMLDARNRMYDLFGVRGITPAGVKNEDTVRGKVIVKGLDTDRIGGGITEYLEQWCDDVYNWVVQLLYVYDDIFASAPGAKLPRIKVSVNEGSLLPKDSTTKANQAIDLAGAGKMSVLDLYKALEYPNPEEMAVNLWLEANAPEVLFQDDPRVKQVVQQKAQAAAAAQQTAAQAKAGGGSKGPSESIAFKDLPPEGKVQMAKQAGIELSAPGIIHHEVASVAAKKAIDVHGSNAINKVKMAQRVLPKT